MYIGALKWEADSMKKKKENYPYYEPDIVLFLT